MKIKTEALIRDLRETTEELIKTVKEKFDLMKAEQLNKRPSEDKWSIAECLEHLNLYGDYYIPAIENAIEKCRNSKAKEMFNAGWMGNYSAKAMLPKNGIVTNTMKSPKNKNPAFIDVPENVIDRFLGQQNDMLTLLERARSVNLERTKVPISISTFIRFKLGDTFRFVVYHNIRHMNQAENVYKAIVK